MNPHATAKATCTLEMKIIRADGTIEIVTVPAEVLDQDALRKFVTEQNEKPPELTHG